MKNTLHLIAAMILVVATVSCDPLWIRESTVKIAPNTFPACAEAAMRGRGLEPEQHTDPYGATRLQAGYMSGVLDVSLAKKGSNHGQLLEVVLIGGGFKPPLEVRPQLSEAMSSISSAIAKACSDG